MIVDTSWVMFLVLCCPALNETCPHVPRHATHDWPLCADIKKESWQHHVKMFWEAELTPLFAEIIRYESDMNGMEWRGVALGRSKNWPPRHATPRSVNPLPDPCNLSL